MQENRKWAFPWSQLFDRAHIVTANISMYIFSSFLNTHLIIYLKLIYAAVTVHWKYIDKIFLVILHIYYRWADCQIFSILTPESRLINNFIWVGAPLVVEGKVGEETGVVSSTFCSKVTHATSTYMSLAKSSHTTKEAI